MYLDAETVRIEKMEDRLALIVGEERHDVHRVARAFPRSDPEHFVSFLDEKGHEVGIVEHPDRLDAASREVLETELKRIYFVPTVDAITDLTRQGTGTIWTVTTDDGERKFRVQSRDMLDGEDAPTIIVSDDGGKRYRIENFWELDRESRNLIKDMIPDKVLRSKMLARNTKGMVMKMR